LARQGNVTTHCLMSGISDLKLITKADAAACFGVCVKTIDNYVDQGLLPRPVAFASKEYWHPDDFREFLAQRFKRPHDEATSLPSSPLDTDTMKRNVVPKSVARRKPQSTLERQSQRQDEKLARLNGVT
jgi:hypothetical protein